MNLKSWALNKVNKAENIKISLMKNAISDERNVYRVTSYDFQNKFMAMLHLELYDN